MFYTLSILAFFVYISLGFYILMRNRFSKANRVFFYFSLSQGLWAACFSFFYGFADRSVLDIASRIATLGWTFSISLLLHFILIITGHTRSSDNRIKPGMIIIWTLIYLPAFVFLVLNLASPPFYQDYIRTPLGYKGVLAPHATAYVAYNLVYILYYAVVIFLLVRWIRKAISAKDKKQGRVLLVTFIIYTFVSLGYYFAEYFLKLKLPQPGPLIMLIWQIGIMISISRYRFLSLDIPVAAEEILAHITELVVLCEPDGSIIRSNQSFREKTGYRDSYLSGKSLTDFFIDKDMIKKTTELLLSTPVLCTDILSALKTASQDPLTVRARFFRIRDRYGDSMGFAMTAIDQTGIEEKDSLALELKECQMKLRIYRTLADWSPHGIIICSQDGTILDTEGGTEQLFGFDKDTMIGRHYDFLFRPFEDQHILIEQVKELQEKGETKGIMSCLTRTGAMVSVEMNFRLLPDPEGYRALILIICREAPSS